MVLALRASVGASIADGDMVECRLVERRRGVVSSDFCSEGMGVNLAHEDAAMEQAAIALCWSARPALLYRNDPMDEVTWWQKQPEREQRLFLIRARAAVNAWERAMEAAEMAHGL